MLPKAHIIAGVLFVTALYFIFPQIGLFNLAIILLSSILIDGDHYIYYIVLKKKFNPIEAIHWHKKEMENTSSLPMEERKKRYTGFYFLHGIEWLVILFLLGIFINPIFAFVFIGFSFHWIIDIPHEFYFKRTIHKSSLIYMGYLLKKFKKKDNKLYISSS
jgi:hypothetical protein